jgi:hypothetical protein
VVLVVDVRCFVDVTASWAYGGAWGWYGQRGSREAVQMRSGGKKESKAICENGDDDEKDCRRKDKWKEVSGFEASADCCPLSPTPANLSFRGPDCGVWCPLVQTTTHSPSRFFVVCRTPSRAVTWINAAAAAAAAECSHQHLYRSTKSPVVVSWSAR